MTLAPAYWAAIRAARVEGLSREDLIVEFERAVARYMVDVRAALDAFEAEQRARSIEDFAVKVQAWEARAGATAPASGSPTAPAA